MNEVEKPHRLYFVDNLRILLTILVIMHHTTITYGALGSWYFRDPNTDELSSILLTIIAALDQGFFMGLFFFISAYFVPGSYNRKGARKFLKDRFIRLGIPILIYTIIVNPILNYLVILQTQSEVEISFIEFYLSYFQSWEGFLNFINGNGPLWFIVMLLVFALFYCSWREIKKKKSEKNSVQKPPNNLKIVIIVIIMSVFTFLIRLWFPMDGGDVILNIQLAFVVQYIIMLILGVIAYKRDWFRNISDSQGKLWLAIAFLSIIYFFTIALLGGAFEGNIYKFQGGFYWQAFAYSIWESFYCIGMSIGLVTLFRKKFNTQGKASKILSENSYTIYLIHAPVLVSIAILFVGLLIPPLLKFAIVLFIVLLLCYVISHFILRRIPGTKRVLG
ncbi:MAG: acyltransferase family protein [Promethearchaeota archaeon]